MSKPDNNLFDLMSAPPAEPKQWGASRNRLETEYAEPFNAWKAERTPATSGALIRAVNPILETAIRPLGNSPVLRGRAKQIALGAMAQYDPSQASLRTHLMTHLQGLRRYAGQQDLPIRVPERILLQQRSLADTTANLSDELGREPSDSELADASGLSLKRIAQIRKFRRPMAEGALTEQIGADGEVGGDPAVEGTTPQEILEDFVYSDLNPRDQLIMDLALGRNGHEKTQSRDIAARLQVTPGAVSQRLAAIQQKFAQMEDMELWGN